MRCVLSRQSWTVMGEQNACVCASHPVANNSSSRSSDGGVRAPSLYKSDVLLQIATLNAGLI